MPHWAAIPFLLGVAAALLMAAYRGYIKGEARAGTLPLVHSKALAGDGNDCCSCFIR
jgi:hypothetical protein